LTLPGLELRPLGSPARSQSLYRLRYPGSRLCVEENKNLGHISRRDLKPRMIVLTEAAAI
jgi:hypothetical protein